MKTFFTFCFTFLLFSSFATIKITATDGDWFVAGNWIPSGVPVFEDTVIVDHNMTISGSNVDFGANWLIVNAGASIVSDAIFGFHGNLKSYGTIDAQTFAIGDGDSTLMYGLFLGEKIALGNPSNINYGSIETDSLIAGEPFENFGSTTNIMFVSATDLWNHAGGTITSETGTISTLALNDVGGIMDLGELVTNESVTNNGFTSCTNWTHGSGTANGSGKYCIMMCFINNATISGTLDICDQSPGGFCDINMGTIAGTVTYCTVGVCNAGLEVLETVVSIYPNPATDQITLKLDESIKGMNYRVSNLFGQQVF